MSINLLFEMSRRSFRALDAAMNATGQNVANVETEGYSRRRVVLQPNGVNGLGIHSRPTIGTVMGTGVSVASYERLKDGMLQRAGWEINAGIGFSDEEQRVLGALEGLFPANSEGSLSKQLTQFWNGWRELADNPTDNGVRLALRSRAAGLASTLNRLDAEINNLQDETQKALASGVDKVNGLFERIAKLNETIANAHNAGSPNLDAEEERDRLLGELSEFAPIRVKEGAAGTVTVTLDGMAVVQGTEVMKLEFDTSGPEPVLRFENTNVTYRTGDTSGRLGSWLGMLKDTLPNTRAALDQLAGTLVREVNAIHRQGYGSNGATGINFFHYDDAGGVEQGVTAGSIRLSDEVLASEQNIAASMGDTATGVHDSDLALRIAGLQDDRLLNGGRETIDTFLINLVGGIGSRIEQAAARYDSQSAAAMHLEAMERGTSGVMLEEEMTNLIRYQQAYQASARVLNTAQQMFDTLLSL